VSHDVPGAPLPEDLRGYLGFVLRRVYALFTAEAIAEGPQSRDFVVLDLLTDGDAHSQQELAERLGINRTIMVRLLDRLQESGYVTRSPNPANRRSHVLSLTDAGRAALDDMRTAVSERDSRITAPLSKRERRRLDALLTSLLPSDSQPAVRSTEYLVAQAHYRMRRLGDSMLDGTGLKVRHFGPLSAIERFGPCPQQQLADHLAITGPAAAEVVDELVRAGLVARGQDPHDRRRYALELTPLGRSRLADVRDAVRRLRAEVLSLLGEKEHDELLALLTKLVESRSPEL
jgi:DNA-binding MarR family transcriptional regulator